jgi:hypothetical protein
MLCGLGVLYLFVKRRRRRKRKEKADIEDTKAKFLKGEVERLKSEAGLGKIKREQKDLASDLSAKGIPTAQLVEQAKLVAKGQDK